MINNLGNIMTAKKLLLVEDDVEISELLCSLLDKEGFTIQTAFDGIKAEEVALEKEFDLSITIVYSNDNKTYGGYVEQVYHDICLTPNKSIMRVKE